MRAAVEHTAELLDELVPGWRQRVDVSALDMDDVKRCLLGQLFDHYDRGVALLRDQGMWDHQVALATEGSDSQHYWEELVTS